MFIYDTGYSQFFNQNYTIIFNCMLFLAEEQMGKPEDLQTECSFGKRGALDGKRSTGWKGEHWMERGALDAKRSTGCKGELWMQRGTLDGKGSTGWKGEHWMEREALDGKGNNGWKGEH